MTVSGAPADRLERARQVADVVIAGADAVDLELALRLLGERGAKQVLAEGGPTLNGQLARAGVLDELCLTVSPKLVSGESKRIVTGGDLPMVADMELRSVCEEDGFLFLRYRSA